MALAVSAETARAQMLAVVAQAESCKTDFEKYVAVRTARFNDKDLKIKLQEIEDAYIRATRFSLPLLKQLGEIKEAHKDLPEWKVKKEKWNLGQPKVDNLPNFYTEQQQRINSVIHEVQGLRNQAIKQLSGTVGPNK